MDNANIMITTLLAAVITAAVPILLKYFTAYLKTQSEELKKANKQKELDKYIDMATNTVIDVVTSLAQTTVDSLKKEGAFTKERQEEVFQKAKDEVVYMLSEEALKALQEVYGDVNNWLNNKIEAEVRNLKGK